MGNGKKVTNIASNTAGLVMKIKSIIAFFGTALGHIVFWIIVVLLLALIIYVIVSVIALSIGRLIGVSGGVQSGNESYEYLKDLTSSGYDSMLSAKELVDYQAFEYAVLMDAARFMEDTGTRELVISQNHSPIDCEKLSRDEWSLLAALALAPHQNDATFENGGENSTNTTNNSTLQQLFDSITDGVDPRGGAPQEVEPPVLNPDNTYKNDFIDTAYFSTEHSKENLFYEPVYNEYTKETSLIPYLNITRNYDIVTYSMEYKASSDSEQEIVDAQGSNFNLGDTPFIQQLRFECGPNHSNYNGIGWSQQFIYDHIYPVSICQELNASNQFAYKQGDPSYVKPSQDDVIDLYKDGGYNESTYYTVGARSTDHHIPLEILLERFLPDALLLSSWRILKDDESDSSDVVDEIQKIYSDACLTDEESSGEKLLVKDVYKVSDSINANTNANDLLQSNKILLEESELAEYANGTKTSNLYNAYAPKFDSRIWKTAESGGADDATVPVASTQTFEGGFSGDVIDDIELALAHFLNNNKLEIKKEIYDQILSDAGRIINPTESQPISEDAPNAQKTNGEYLLYHPLESSNTIQKGKYLVNCKEKNADEQTFKKHYGLDASQSITTRSEVMKEYKHADVDNPYNAPEEFKKCFEPLIKVAYTQENGIRSTAVIIHYNGIYNGYVIRGKEIMDYSKISNVNTFAFFESRDMSATIARHWNVASTNGGSMGETSEEKWVVVDAFEGAKLTLTGGITVRVSYTADYIDGSSEQESFSIYFSGNDINKKLSDYLRYNGDKVPEAAIFGAGSVAIVRTPEIPDSRDYTGLLNLPTNPSINAGDSALIFGGSSSQTGGEAILTDSVYINLRELGLSPGEVPVFTLSSVSKTDLIPHANDSEYMKRFVCTAKKQGSASGSMTPLDSAACNSYMEAAGITAISGVSVSVVDMPNVQINEYSAVMPVRRSEVCIKQEFWDSNIRFYLVAGAKNWANVSKFNNSVTITGEYKNRSHPYYLISANQFCSGLTTYNSYKDAKWRCKMYAPIFAGNSNEEATKARETDVLMILSEWLEASEDGNRAADFYIRDLNSLIQYSKGIKAEDSGDSVSTEYEIEPTRKPDGTPYINPGSYTYLYIPDEIIQFDDTTSEKAFWLDRILSTPSDPIEQDTENYLRSRLPTFTWQIVDYDLYEECRNSNGTSSVYALWPFGSQSSRLLYAIAANSCEEENKKVIESWGGYSKGMHEAADLYSRSQTEKIIKTVFVGDEALIKSYYNNGSVSLNDPSLVEDVGNKLTFFPGEEGMPSSTNSLGANVSVETDGTGLYFKNAEVTLILDGNEYHFNGTAASAYGYMLYQKTKILKNAEKAEEQLKEELEREEKWAEIYAVVPGIVEAVNSSARGGFNVKIKHADGMSSSSVHMKRYPLVQVGQYVGAGTVLGYEGTTGNSNGNHIHFAWSNSENPVEYFYPFFSPFYYEEKAAEADYALDSDYMSLERTVFPYGQVPGVELPANTGEDIPGAINSGSAEEENGIVKIKNYVPLKRVLSNSADLYKEGSPGYIDYSKTPAYDVYGSKIKTDLGGSNYNGEILETNPMYFDEEFIKWVKENHSKITSTNDIDGEGGSSSSSENDSENSWENSSESNSENNSENNSSDSNKVYSKYPFTNDRRGQVITKGTYTAEDYERMEKELEERIEKAGKGTRAAVLEAAKFLLELEYLVPYNGYGGSGFSEYGKGLNEKWGYYGTVQSGSKAGEVWKRGLDCSGYTKWIFANAEVTMPTNKTGSLKNYANNVEEVEPGDVLQWRGDRVINGVTQKNQQTHIAIVLGKDSEYIYIAEAVDPGLRISKMTIAKMKNLRANPGADPAIILKKIADDVPDGNMPTYTWTPENYIDRNS